MFIPACGGSFLLRAFLNFQAKQILSSAGCVPLRSLLVFASDYKLNTAYLTPPPLYSVLWLAIKHLLSRSALMIPTNPNRNVKCLQFDVPRWRKIRCLLPPLIDLITQTYDSAQRCAFWEITCMRGREKKGGGESCYITAASRCCLVRCGENSK